MAKGDSAKRGYMTSEEIEEHLTGFKSGEEKIAYLNTMLARRDIDKNTRKKLRSTFIDIYNKTCGVGMNGYRAVIENLRKTGCRDVAEALALEGKTVASAEVYEGMGRKLYGQKAKYSPEERRDFLTKALNMYKEAGLEKSVPNVRSELAELMGTRRKESSSERQSYLLTMLHRGFVVLAIGASIFFINSSITGNAIANLSNTTSNYIGLCLLALGCISGFFWVKNKNRK